MSRVITIAQAKQAALGALQRYELDWERLAFNQSSDTITFKVDTTANERYLLRIHSEKMSKEELCSELEWLRFLGKTDTFTVPQGVADREGSYVIEVENVLDLSACATLMRWVEGEAVDGHLNENHISHMRNMGILLAQLHQATASFVPSANFVRPTWCEESFKRDLSHLEQNYGCFLTEDGFRLYQSAADKILDHLATMQKNDRNYGLIHADLHLGNIVFRDEKPFPIDFARCGFGYYLYDIAQLLSGGLYPIQRQIVLEGYESIRSLDDGYVQTLECFFVMAAIESCSIHSSDPRETESLIEQQPYLQAVIRYFLKDDPFLFNPIEIN